MKFTAIFAEHDHHFVVDKLWLDIMKQPNSECTPTNPVTQNYCDTNDDGNKGGDT